jgi:hypothetical protein
MNASMLQVRRAWEKLYFRPMPEDKTYENAVKEIVRYVREETAKELVASMSNDPTLTTTMERFKKIFVEVKGPNRIDHLYHFVATFKEEPNNQDVAIAQNKAGYHPAGYGGPYIGKTVQDNGKWIVTFHCHDNCD